MLVMNHDNYFDATSLLKFEWWCKGYFSMFRLLDNSKALKMTKKLDSDDWKHSFIEYVLHEDKNYHQI
jgi:hypothetical protein